MTIPAPRALPPSELPTERLLGMGAAATEVLECQRVLAKGGLNVVGEVLKGHGTFYEYNHYPAGDVYDQDTYSQYYYHAHRGLPGEHGHFHTFIRQCANLPGIDPVPNAGEAQWPGGPDALAHLVAVSMDRFGYTTGLFTTNRWVTDETWYRADDVIRMLPSFEIDHASPSWPVNRWLSGLLRLFGTEIEALLRHRDTVVSRWAAARPGTDVYEDRQLEITGSIPVSVDRRAAEVRAEIERRSS